ncbi:unnamed protein product [Didymodactylos carnosus]|uniref:Uncharacterized protein n=1 Tax=Didymodactylos carnosus TaxID=1234261 RepID=A0A814DF52_9BILA|nr:unnamed protein product [Didymodactylos carnosus]CAF3730136.1 unnamed protein product [Didymodactylos carnosus]
MGQLVRSMDLAGPENLELKTMSWGGKGRHSPQANFCRPIRSPGRNLFEKYNVPHILDLLSIDIDYDDYWVWKAIDLHRFDARAVVIEYNWDISYTEHRVVDPNDKQRWTGTNHFGASILAMTTLGKKRGYTLVYAEREGVNLFFVKTDILQCQNVLDQVMPIDKLAIKNPGWQHRMELDKNRTWIWNDTSI